MAEKIKITEVGGKLSDVAATLIKKYGRGSIMTADQVSNVIIPRIPSGSFLQDVCLGGGWPIGRVSLVYGNKSTGKSTTCVRLVRNAQYMCGSCYRMVDLEPGMVEVLDPNTGEVNIVKSMVVANCKCGNAKSMNAAWIDQEGTWASKWAKAHGVFEERLLLSRPQYAEEAIDIVEALLYTPEIDLIVLDSVAAMTPGKEIEASAVDFQQGLHARLMNKAVRVWTSAIQARFQATLDDPTARMPTLILVNQIREKVGVMFGNPETTPGGKGVGFATSVEMKTFGGNKNDYTIDEEAMETLRVKLKCCVEKNKVSPAKLECEYEICVTPTEVFHTGQILDDDDVFAHAVRVGVIKKISDRKFEYEGQTFNSKGQFVSLWAANEELYNEVKAETLGVILGRKV